MTKEQFILRLQDIGAIKFGNFTLKSGKKSPFYIDLRDLVSDPELLEASAALLTELIEPLGFDVVTGIPYTALPIATLVADKIQKPLVYMRKEPKAYGTGKNIIGNYPVGAKCLVIDDLITTGESKIETAEAYEKEGVTVKDFVVVIDRSADGTEYLGDKGYKLHSLISLDEIVETLQRHQLISDEKVKEVEEFTASLKAEAVKPASKLQNPLTDQLLAVMAKKQSNLVLSLDVHTQQEFFDILETVAPYIAMVKTHVDILDDYNENFVPRLTALAEKENFVIFEDRKFADIGNTVRKQYRGGVYRIADWSPFVTVHTIVGEGIIKGLFEGLEGRSSFLLARMSAKGNLINEAYSRKTLEIGEKYASVVSGYIGHGSSIEDIQRFKNKIPQGQLLLMPGVQLEKGSDNLGQQYLSVEDAMAGGADCIIVGRGIIAAENPTETAKVYQQRAWAAYQARG